MEDFHDSSRRAGQALDATASVEAEAQAASSGAATPQAPTGVGAGTSGSATPHAATGGGGTSGSATPQTATRGGADPSGSGAPLATPPPEPAAGGRDRHPRDPLTYPTHHTRAAQRALAVSRRKEHQGPPRLTKRGRILICMWTLVVHSTLFFNYSMHFRIQLLVISHL
jgi:hypothetical protein